MSADPYLLLGVPRDCDDAALKAAYRAKIRAAHPDLVAAEGEAAVAAAEAAAKALNEAYAAVKRDRAGREAVAAARVGEAPDAHDALRVAKVAVGTAHTKVRRWRNDARAFTRARRRVTAERAAGLDALATLERALRGAQAAHAALSAEPAALIHDRLLAPVLRAVAAAERARSPRGRAQATADAQAAVHDVSPGLLNGVAKACQAAVDAAVHALGEAERRASRAQRALSACEGKARVERRNSGQAARRLRAGVEAAAPPVEQAVVAAARAAGLARVEAASANEEGRIAARRNVERARTLVVEAARIESEQLTGEAVVAEANGALAETRAAWEALAGLLPTADALMARLATVAAAVRAAAPTAVHAALTAADAEAQAALARLPA
ncbi:MAG: J domain-containing protein [Myxococcales bacterium]|nr:J domain-containing protein [Myxococcales bacterium]